MTFQEGPAASFEKDKFGPGVPTTLGQTRRASDRGRNSGGADLRAADIFWNIKEHGATGQVDIARSTSEAENRIGSEARQRLVREGELGPGINACAYSGAIADFITDDGWARRCLRPQQFHLFHYL